MLLLLKGVGKHWTISDDHHTPHPKSFNPSPFLQWPRSFSGLHPKGLTPLSTWWSLWKLGAYEPQSTGLKHHMTVTVGCWPCPHLPSPPRYTHLGCDEKSPAQYWGLEGCASYLSLDCDKTPTKSNPRKEGSVLAHSSGGSHGGRNLGELSTSCSQSGGRRAWRLGLCSLLPSYSVQESRWLVLLISINLVKKSLTGAPEDVSLGSF